MTGIDGQQRDIAEMMSRLIHIEDKTNRILAHCGALGKTTHPLGHPDQAFGPITYAQHGEDLIILNLFHLLDIQRPSYLDIGAYHPINLSNTALLYSRGSRGVNIEANPNLIDEFHIHRPDDVNLNIGVGIRAGKQAFYCIDKWSGRNTFIKEIAEDFVAEHSQFRIETVIEIETITINDVYKKYLGSKWPNLFSIDVEGMDYQILASADFRGRGPEVICAEAVSGADKDQGPALIELLRERSYAPVFRTVGNIFFIRDDLVQRVMGTQTGL